MEYVCECGKIFTNSQSFNGHKSNCKVHIEAKGKITWEQYLEKQNDALKSAAAKAAQLRKEKANEKYNLKKIEWESNIHYCERCCKELPHNYEDIYGSGRFCSRQCANSRHHSEETKNKIAKSCTGKIYNKEGIKKEKRFCKNCGKEIKYKNISGYCKDCYRDSTIPEVFERLSLASKKGAQSKRDRGTGIYWQSRNIQSYPEKFWQSVLINNNIVFEGPNKAIKKKDGKNNYFLDFYIEKNNKKIDLEIDGKQHEYVDRNESDKIRDEYLSSLNYIVYRVKWNEINSKEGSLIMKSKIDDFLEFYNSL